MNSFSSTNSELPDDIEELQDELESVEAELYMLRFNRTGFDLNREVKRFRSIVSSILGREEETYPYFESEGLRGHQRGKRIKKLQQRRKIVKERIDSHQESIQ